VEIEASEIPAIGSSYLCHDRGPMPDLAERILEDISHFRSRAGGHSRSLIGRILEVEAGIDVPEGVEKAILPTCQTDTVHRAGIVGHALGGIELRKVPLKRQRLARAHLTLRAHRHGFGHSRCLFCDNLKTTNQHLDDGRISGLQAR
jgi:hypothetical protein